MSSQSTHTKPEKTMRILYAYTEFRNQKGQPSPCRGFEHFEINLGKNIYNVTTLAGDNGSGKTTILNCVIGLMLSDYRNDVERTHLKGSEGENWLGIFFAYEQYKQVKYVFDKKAVCHIEAPERAGISRPCASKGDGHDGIGGCEDGAVRRERRSAA